MQNMYDNAREDTDTLKDRYLTFLIDSKVYGIEIGYVIEIVGIQVITGIPETPAYIKGLINLRGRIIPVMDVRARFGLEEEVYNDRTCIIVVKFKEYLYGFIVDSVSEVLMIREENIEETPKIVSARNNFVRNIGKEGDNIVLLLACEKLLTDAAPIPEALAAAESMPQQ